MADKNRINTVGYLLDQKLWISQRGSIVITHLFHKPDNIDGSPMMPELPILNSRVDHVGHNISPLIRSAGLSVIFRGQGRSTSTFSGLLQLGMQRALILAN